MHPLPCRHTIHRDILNTPPLVSILYHTLWIIICIPLYKTLAFTLVRFVFILGPLSLFLRTPACPSPIPWSGLGISLVKQCATRRLFRILTQLDGFALNHVRCWKHRIRRGGTCWENDPPCKCTQKCWLILWVKKNHWYGFRNKITCRTTSKHPPRPYKIRRCCGSGGVYYTFLPQKLHPQT